ncbi:MULTISPECIES: hypothetical protein [Serratia]|uniref:hypothetical protein n=1 Tax=Serratia TaxID=613 RepID=UPI000A455267|nr:MULTISPECIES: hypothetical protein [Serratia]EIU0886961.1 hypothetical protein [Serratia marcescens]MDK5931707.1 hypothetical protein [Serratia nevei]MDP8728922.1 hypothetical protein [Serratia marcescens]MEC5551514.1 hypothetical protein [Serratia nevei]MEC5627101.1 hypothetical protein [Serratia nevei]
MSEGGESLAAIKSVRAIFLDVILRGQEFFLRNLSALRNNRLQFAKSRSRVVFVKFRIFSRLMMRDS